MKLVIADEARGDLFDIWVWTDSQFGESQADRYLEFLRQEALRVAASPELGSIVRERTGFFSFTARWRSGGYGHVLIYSLHGDTMNLVHVFHTAQDWRSKLEEP